MITQIIKEGLTCQFLRKEERITMMWHLPRKERDHSNYKGNAVGCMVCMCETRNPQIIKGKSCNNGQDTDTLKNDHSTNIKSWTAGQNMTTLHAQDP